MPEQSPIHVLHVLNSASGGSAISTFELISELSLKGVKSSLICFNNATPEQAQKIHQLVEGRVLFIPLYWMNKRIRAAWWKRPLIELKALWDTQKGFRHQGKIRKFIHQHQITIIHTSTIVNPEGAIAAKKNNLPHVWHVRELIGKDKHFRFYNFTRWSRWVAANCDVLVANSAVTAQCLQVYFEADKIVTIPNGIRVNIFDVKIHADKKQIIVGMIGSPMSRWKNHAFLIRVAALLKMDNVEFRIYGALPSENDTYYSGLKQLINELEVTGSVKFMDRMAPENIMREIDILFHPTHLESFGRIFIEAMAGGIPIVAVNEGGALEMVRDRVNGFLVPLNDTYAASQAIRELGENADIRDTYSRNGRSLAEKQFSMKILLNRIIDVYVRVLRK